MIEINKKNLIFYIFNHMRISENCFIYSKSEAVDCKNNIIKILNERDESIICKGYFSFMRSIKLIKILNYIENGSYIKNKDDIMFLEIIYMDMFEKLYDIVRDNNIDKETINILLLEKIGKEDFRRIIKRISR